MSCKANERHITFEEGCWTFRPNSLYHSRMLLYTQEERVSCQCTFGSRLHEESVKVNSLCECSKGSFLTRTHVPGASAADLASLRRLLFEAQTLALAQMRMQITEPDSASKRVPEAERERRLASLRTSLTGLCIEGPLEPGRKLLDEACHQEGTGQLKYLPPDKCISRLHEVTHAKESARQIELEQTRLVIREAQESPNMPASSAFQVLEALQWRGLAYVFAQAVTWTEYDRYLTKLFAHMSRDPPPGFNKVSVSQIVEADRQVFVRVIEANVKPCETSSGVMPMDDALMNALEGYEVSFVLMRTPSKVTPAPKRPPKRPRLVSLCRACHAFCILGSRQQRAYRARGCREAGMQADAVQASLIGSG